MMESLQDDREIAYSEKVFCRDCEEAGEAVCLYDWAQDSAEYNYTYFTDNNILYTIYRQYTQ